jgi:predicted MPP superfamily phosphohydrolase
MDQFHPHAMNDALDAFYRILPLPLVWLGATLGQPFWITVAMNVTFAHPLPRKLLHYIREGGVLAILSSPFLFLAVVLLTPTDGGGFARWILLYTAFCVVLGFVVAPICQVLYWLRPTAPQLTSTKGELVDFAQTLGYRPIGRGKYDKLCRIPFNQVFEVEFNEKVLTLPQIPSAWDGLTILHLSDLHYCGTPDRRFHQAVLEHCMRGGPADIVAMTGDVVDSDWHYHWIVPLLGRLKWNLAAFGILGNHDAWRDEKRVRRRLEKIGMTVLANTWRELDVRGHPMIVLGHEGPWFGTKPDLAGCPEGVFRLCLSHTPDHIPWARKQHIDLVLAGHVHGGQIRFPLIGSTFVPSRWSRRYDCGTFFEAPTVMHVSRGLAGQHPLRIRCRPEVTRIILRKG